MSIGETTALLIINLGAQWSEMKGSTTVSICEMPLPARLSLRSDRLISFAPPRCVHRANYMAKLSFH